MAPTTPFNVLVFSKTTGYRHSSIPTGISALSRLATQTGLFTVTASEDASIFNPSSLSTFRVIILLHPSGDFLSPPELKAFQDFVRAGGGVLAIHCATAGMPSSEWYGKLVGAHFDMHPDPEPGQLIVADVEHPIIDNTKPPEKWMDEWYNFTSHPSENSSLRVLLRGDTSSFKGGKHGDDHPLAWCQEFEGGRSAYIALGHFDEAWDSEWFVGL
ncbi:hypothetical protein E8E13_004345 [Curvularia kusanoi]|uniref:ThuA-like domain-containing protein n=1 Tax=Curvularia kusanoi TaxID=90978 RepID=A0A9P4TH75_CURKU|nr:hypothetical protein E8E13_004345 [Curvularia kusanoi]